MSRKPRIHYPGALYHVMVRGIDDGFQYSDKYEIVGITNNSTDKDYYVFVPKSDEFPISPYYIGYTAGYAVIKNSDVAVFYENIEPLMTGRLLLTVYDQGYSSVAEPFTIILNVIKIVTVVCAIMELAMLLLFGFLFVYRQRETYKIMLLLGSGEKRVCAYFLYSSGFISLIATALGTVAGYYLHARVVRFVLDIPASGQVLFEDKPTSQMDLDRYRRECAAVIYQRFKLFPLLTISENITYPMELRGFKGKRARDKSKELVQKVALPETVLDRFPSMISGGEQQRVAIARALSMDSKLILADEPTGNLDEENSRNIIDILINLARIDNYCVIIATHDISVIPRMDVVYRMNSGELFFENDKLEISKS